MPHTHRGKKKRQNRARGEIKNGCARLPKYDSRDAAQRELPSNAPDTDAAKIRYCRNCRRFHIYTSGPL